MRTATIVLVPACAAVLTVVAAAPVAAAPAAASNPSSICRQLEVQDPGWPRHGYCVSSYRTSKYSVQLCKAFPFGFKLGECVSSLNRDIKHGTPPLPAV